MFSARSRFSSAIASCADRFVSDEYDDLDSASNLTAFARNSGVYRVPFAMVPSSPIELEEKRNKKQAISVAPQLLDCGVFLQVGVHSTSW